MSNMLESFVRKSYLARFLFLLCILSLPLCGCDKKQDPKLLRPQTPVEVSPSPSPTILPLPVSPDVRGEEESEQCRVYSLPVEGDSISSQAVPTWVPIPCSRLNEMQQLP